MVVNLHRRDFLWGAGAAAAAATLPLVGCKKKEGAATDGKASLVVGGLPVTCNLTLPVSCTARANANDGQLFEYSKYSGWPEIKESLMSGRIQAAYMLAPLVMDLTTK